MNEREKKMMRNGPKKILALLLSGSMMAGLLTGCGGGANTAGSEPAAKTKAASDAADTAGATELTIGMSTTWETLTPFRNMSSYSILYGRMLYDTLAYRMADGSVIPVVAKEWSAEEDGKTWNIEIYDYVKDSAGNQITASDIVWMIGEQKNRALKPAFNRVQSVEQTGDYTLKVVMKEDIVGSIENVLQHTYVVSQAAFEASGDEFVSNVVSTSPYKVTNFVSGSSLTLEKRDDYWQDEALIDRVMANNLDKVTFKYISESSQQQIALETGEVNVFATIDSSLMPTFEENSQFVAAPSNYLIGNELFFSGHESSPLANNPDLCKAIAYAIDEQGIIDGVYGGLAARMYDAAPYGLLGYQESWKTEEYYSYDPENAKEYLAKSGYQGEELVVLASNSTRNNRMLTMIQAYLLDVGINLKLNLVDRALYTASLTDGSAYDMVQVSAGGNDLPSFWGNRFDCNAYESGDATSRKDETLTDMIYSTWTSEGFTEENINAIHDYVNEHMYAYGICQPMTADVYSTSIGLNEKMMYWAGGIDFIASTYGQ